MSIAAIVSTIKESIALVGKLRELTKKMQQAELKSTIADLANHLADANLKVAELKNDLAALKEENENLKSRTDGVKPQVKWGCYIFEGDEKLYCPACYDTKAKKHLTTRVNSSRRKCCVCQTELGS